MIPYTNPEFFDIKKANKVKLNFVEKISKIDIDTIIFTNSEYTKNELLKYFPKFKNENVITTLLAADSNKYYKLEDIDLNQKYILSLCSLNKRKNLAFLVESFVEFLDKNPQVQDLNLVLAGPKGWLMDEMFKSIEKAEKYKDKIIITGFIEDNDMNIIYNSAFMFIFPSLAEGFGIPVLEAMQCGISVISANTTSLPEVYGDSAIGINPTNKGQLVEAISNLYNNENLREKLSNDGLEQSKKFNWGKTLDNMVKEYLKN